MEGGKKESNQKKESSKSLQNRANGMNLMISVRGGRHRSNGWRTGSCLVIELMGRHKKCDQTVP